LFGHEVPKKGIELETIPVVYCVVPVHNRLDITKRFLAYIKEQDYPAVSVIIVDDGSTDGTGEYLTQASQSNLIVLKGDGNLWWSGAMHLGISYVMNLAVEGDYLLMINDDVHIEKGYISTLVRESVFNDDAVVGSSQRDEISGTLLNSGYHIDFWRMRFSPIDRETPHTSVDAVSGRGVLFPIRAVLRVGNINARIFPHYLGDLEYTAKVTGAGWKIFVSKAACVYTSSEPSDRQVRDRGVFYKYFSLRSKHNLIHRILFFSVRGPLLLRMLVIPRLPFALFAKFIR